MFSREGRGGCVSLHCFLCSWTFCHEVCRSEEEKGQSTFLTTRGDGGGGAWVKGERTTKIRKGVGRSGESNGGGKWGQLYLNTNKNEKKRHLVNLVETVFQWSMSK